eukprot:COSAG02_NODE_80_length_40128_cov_591.169002_16_plen_154_part_00
MTSDASGATIWSAAQNRVKGMDLSDLERAVGARGGGGDNSDGAGASAASSGSKGCEAAKAAAKEARTKKKQEAERAKLAALKRGPGTAPSALKELEQRLMPLVKKGDELQRSSVASDLVSAMSLYEQAMAGFRSSGFSRPKLQAKIGDLQQRL